MNFSGMMHRISGKFILPIPDLGLFAQSLLFIAGDVNKSNIFLTMSGSLNYTYLCLPVYAHRIVAMFAIPVSYSLRCEVLFYVLL